jgi:hypothetical protein
VGGRGFARPRGSRGQRLRLVIGLSALTAGGVLVWRAGRRYDRIVPTSPVRILAEEQCAAICTRGKREGPGSGIRSSRLSLSIRRAETAEGLIVSLIVTNQTRYRYWIANGWPRGAIEAPRSIYPVWFEVERDGDPVTAADDYPFFPRRATFRVLHPGESYEQQYDLAVEYNPVGPACYVVRAFYENDSARTPKDPGDVVPISPALASDPLCLFVANDMRPKGVPVRRGDGAAFR